MKYSVTELVKEIRFQRFMKNYKALIRVYEVCVKNIEYLSKLISNLPHDKDDIAIDTVVMQLGGKIWKIRTEGEIYKDIKVSHPRPSRNLLGVSNDLILTI